MAVGDSTAEDRLHFQKNRPDLPPGYSRDEQAERPYVHQEFPRWIYHDREPARIVKDDSELANFLSRGWAMQPHEARQAFEAHELEVSNNAAQRASDDRRMSDKAKAEHETADASADDHVLDLPAPKADKKKAKADKAKE